MDMNIYIEYNRDIYWNIHCFIHTDWEKHLFDEL